MSVYFCDGCDAPRDADVHGFNDLSKLMGYPLEDRPLLLCDVCFVRLHEAMGRYLDATTSKEWQPNPEDSNPG